MNKINALNKEIERLQEEKARAQEIIKMVDNQCNLKYGEIAKAYEDFYTSKVNKEFVLYEKFPSLSALEIYLRRVSDQFPLQDYGKLNIKELTEIIKHLYQFKTGKEYKIFTMGAVELDGSPVYGGQVFSSRPHLYFMVGNDKTLEPYQEYNGKFVNSDRLYLNVYCHARGRNIINIEAEQDDYNLGMECLTGHIFDKSNVINYFNECYHQYMNFQVSAKKQIFSDHIRSSLNFSGGYKKKGIKDVMDFILHPDDTYIAKVLISIVIYKRNNHIQDLSNDDYKHIFDVLFGEKVDIVENAKKDIPKQLIYVPNEKSGR